ncbi:MAG: hypothetical protein ACJ8GW_11570 [Massilia sp.]
MTILKPVLVLVILSSALLCNNAWATEPPPRVGALPAPPPANSAVKADKQVPAPPPTVKKPLKRRAVRQILNDEVRPATSYLPRPMPPLQAPMPSTVPPSPIMNCVGGNCTDSNGGHYQGGVGTSLISPQGRLCNNNGMTVQCF